MSILDLQFPIGRQEEGRAECPSFVEHLTPQPQALQCRMLVGHSEQPPGMQPGGVDARDTSDAWAVTNIYDLRTTTCGFVYDMCTFCVRYVYYTCTVCVRYVYEYVYARVR